MQGRHSLVPVWTQKADISNSNSNSNSNNNNNNNNNNNKININNINNKRLIIVSF